MARYDVKCNKCGKEFEGEASVAQRLLIKCSKCSGATRILLKQVPMFSVFQPFWHEDLSPEPVRINSTRELKDENKKHGMRPKDIGLTVEV